jgi:choline dehydrogenase-like flavoprotein
VPLHAGRLEASPSTQVRDYPAAYDTVIVDARSAGCVIASRMTESSAHDVLLVEAGPDHGASARPPDLRNGTRNSYRTHDWGLSHHASLAAAFEVPMPRGRVVGGSSAVNTCIALRGLPADYDEWASRGLSAWSWERVKPGVPPARARPRLSRRRSERGRSLRCERARPRGAALDPPRTRR